MTTVIQDGEGYKIYSKGAPEVILRRCSGIMLHDGSVGTFPEDPGEIVKTMQEKSQLKVMCLAYKHLGK